jgi:hypothetical protein
MEDKVLVLLTACIMFSACGTSPKEYPSADVHAESSHAEIRPNFYKKLKGKIGGDLFITVDIIKRRDTLNKQESISGHYYYDKIGMPLYLSGTMQDSGSFVLHEMNGKGEATGEFSGRFVSDTEIKGTWTNPKTKKQYPFELKEVETTKDLFVFTEHFNENCKVREGNMKSTRKDTLFWQDTLCASLHLSLVSLAENGNKIHKKINEALTRGVLSLWPGEKPPASIHEMLHSIGSYGPGDVMEGEYSTNIVSFENNILSMSVGGWANTGGAHPNGYSIFLNFDMRTGDTISLLDVVKPETIDELVFRAKQQFIKENGNLKENGWFFGEEFVLPHSFSIGKGGLLFEYNSYEAGPYAMGMPQFFLSWKQIKDIVREEYLK